MYEGMSLAMAALMKVDDLASAYVKKALAEVDKMTSFHRVLMFKDLADLALDLSIIHGVSYESIQRDLVQKVLEDVMDSLRKKGYRDVVAVKAMDGDEFLGYAIEFNEPFNHVV